MKKGNLGNSGKDLKLRNSILLDGQHNSIQHTS